MSAQGTAFEPRQLLPDERLLMRRRAQLATAGPPGWWEGELFLTSDRLFFLPIIMNDLIGDAAFWLAGLRYARAESAGVLCIADDDREATFRLQGIRILSRGARARTWVDAIDAARPAARPGSELAVRPDRVAG
jgi:hypothetical protein